MTSKITTTHFRGCKVALLGARRSGKSTLARALAGETQDSLNNSSVTIHQLSPPNEPSQDIDEYREISLWDFSGHDGYRVIHELLLDNIDIVLLTIDLTTRHHDEQYKAILYWMDVVRRIQSTQDNQITKYLVLTKSEDLHPINLKPDRLHHLLHRFGVDDIFVTSCNHGLYIGVTELRQILYDAINWQNTQTFVDHHDLNTLIKCIEKSPSTDYILNRHDLYIDLLYASSDLISTSDYNQLLFALELRGTIFQFPQQDSFIRDINILEYYIVKMLEIPRKYSGHDNDGSQFVPVSRSDILQHPVTIDIPISDEQHRTLNGLILHFLAFRNLLIIDNQDIIFLSNLVKELSSTLSELNSALILDMRLFPSMNFSQLIVRINRSEVFQLVEYWSNRAVFANEYGEYHIIHPKATQTLTEIWIYCSSNTRDYARLVFETYVYDLITDIGNVTTLETSRHYVCETCGTPFEPEELEGGIERIACVLCETINYLPLRPSQLPYNQQVQLLQDAEQIIRRSVTQFQQSLDNYKIELRKLDRTIDCMLVFERYSDVAEDVLRINAELRNDGMNTFLMPTNGMSGIDLSQLKDHFANNRISRIMYFVGGNHQIQAQMPFIDCVHSHYQPLQFYFLVVAVHPTIITSSHPMINRGFNVIEWSPDRHDWSTRLLSRIRDNRMQGVEDVYGRLNKPTLQEFPFFGQAILHFFSIKNILPLYSDTRLDSVKSLLIPNTLDLDQFWRANLNISDLNIKNSNSLIYIRREQDNNEFKLVMALRKHYNAEFIIIIDVNVLVPFPLKGTSKFIYLDVRALMNLIKTTNRDGWFRRYLVRNLRGGGPKFIETILPFDTNKIADEEKFFGRYKLVNTIKQEIIDESLAGRFIFGPKRSGKTSLLNRIKGMLAGTRYVPIMLTAGGSLSIETFIQSILSNLGLDVGADVTPNEWIHLMQQFQQNDGRIPVLLLDEMDHLILEDSEKGYQLSYAIVKLAYSGVSVFFLAGHSVLRSVASDEYSNYFGLMDAYYATGIEQDAAYRLLQKIVQQVDFVFADEQLQDIYEGTGGIPYLMIHFCQDLLNSMVSNLEEQEVSFDHKIEDYLIKRVKINRGFLSTVHNYFTYDHHDLLAIILKMISESDRITREEIITRLSNRKFPVSSQISDVRQESETVFESLIDLFNIVEEHATGILRIKPRYLHQAFEKQVGKPVDDAESYLPP